jgi:hypothetical protein
MTFQLGRLPPEHDALPEKHMVIGLVRNGFKEMEHFDRDFQKNVV